ncbi:MAG: hypothetical protein ACK5CT_11315 [Bacteroidota bacterium]
MSVRIAVFSTFLLLGLPGMERMGDRSLFLLMLLFAALAYWQVSTFSYCLKWDTMDQYYPWRHFVVESLRSGILPLWNPYEQFGYPIHADPQSGCWYPFLWLVSLVGDYNLPALHLEFMLHVLVGGWGMFRLLSYNGTGRREAFLLGCAYLCCGIFVANAQHLTYVISAAWIPHVVYRFQRLSHSDSIFREIPGFVICTALLLSGGYPAFTIVLAYLLAGYASWQLFHRQGSVLKVRSYLIQLAFSLVGILILCGGFAVSIFQSLEFVSRTQGLDYRIASWGPFSPQSLISLLVPLSTTRSIDFINTDISMASVYCGLFALAGFVMYIWSVKSRTDWVNLSLVTLFLLASFGAYTPVHRVLVDFVPLFDLFRFPSVFRMFFIIGVFLCAGPVLTRSGSQEQILAFSFLRIIVLVFVFASFGPAVFNSAFVNPDRFINGLSTQEAVIVQGVLVFLVLSAVLWCFKRGYPQGMRRHALTVLLLIELLLSVQLNAPVTIVSSFRGIQTQEALNDFQVKGYPVPPVRASGSFNDSIAAPAPLWRNLCLLKKWPAGDGYNSFQTRNYVSFTDNPTLYGKRKPSAWVFFAEGCFPISDSVQCCDSLPTNWVFINRLKQNLVSGSVTDVERFEPGRISVRVNAGSDSSLLVVLQQGAPWWRAEVDGNPVPQLPVDGLFLGVRPGLGQHIVDFTYDNPLVLWAFRISLAGWFLMLVWCIWQLAYGFRNRLQKDSGLG